MQEPVFEPGQTVYTADGRRVSYVAQVAEGHVVQPFMPQWRMGYGGPDEYEEPTGIELVQAVYEKPTKGKIDETLAKSIADATAQLAEVTQKLKDAREEWWLFERDEKNRQERLKRHAALDQLDDFIQGRITHYVVINHSGFPSLVEFEKSSSGEVDTRWMLRVDRAKLRLLGLFGDANGDLAWGLNRYRDGSGNWERVVPCTSLERATEVVRELAEAAFAVILEGKPVYVKEWIECAQKHNIEVPQAVHDILQAERIQRAHEFIASTEERVEEAKELLARVEKGEKVEIPYSPPKKSRVAQSEDLL